MKLLWLSIVVAAAFSAATATAVEPFKVKGKQLGQSSAVACGAAKVTTKLDDLLAKYRPQAPGLTNTDTSECHIAADTFGDLEVDGGIDLLFLSDQLIQLKFELVPVHWMQYGKIFTPLEEMYGKPVIETREPFTSHTWRQGDELFQISRADNSSGVESLEVLLRDERSFHEYERRTEQNREILRRLDTERTKSDLRD